MNAGTNGISSARNGVWRPTIWLRSWVGSPETCPSVVIGITMAPNATGAVSATSRSEAARIGDSPMPISITPQVAELRTEPRERFQQRAEAEGDHDDLHAHVVRDLEKSCA